MDRTSIKETPQNAGLKEILDGLDRLSNGECFKDHGSCR